MSHPLLDSLNGVQSRYTHLGTSNPHCELARALGDFLKQEDRVAEVAHNIGMTAHSLRRSLSGTRSPSLKLIWSVLHQLGIEMTFGWRQSTSDLVPVQSKSSGAVWPYTLRKEFGSVKTKLLNVLREQLGLHPDHIPDTATLDELGADSLDKVELLMALEDDFETEISDDAGYKLEAMTVADAAQWFYDELTRQGRKDIQP